MLPAFAADGVHEATTVGPVLTALQEVDIQLLVPVAGPGLQAAVSVGPVVTVLQLVAVHWLPELAPPAVQNSEPCDVFTVTHCVSTQPLPAVAAIGVHEETPVLGLRVVLHLSLIHI